MVGLGPGVRALPLASCPELARVVSFPAPGRSARAPPLHPAAHLATPTQTRGLLEPLSALACPASEDAPRQGSGGRGVGVRGEKLSVTLLPPALSEPVSAPVCIGANTIPLPPPPPSRQTVSWSSGVNDLSQPMRFFLIKATIFSPSPGLRPPTHRVSTGLYLLLTL